MPISDSDPRVFFAAERTLLAWVRTSLTVMAIGFVIARFGLFLTLVSIQMAGGHAAHQSGFSAALGVLFVTLGALTALAATIQHRRFVATLPASDLPPSYSGAFVIAFAFLTGLLGVGLAAYLVISHAW
ncbi:MAG: YidH family protein [Betaproteobacteria bacterium]